MPSFTERRKYVRDLVIFAVLGSMVFVSRFVTQILPPNVHIVAALLATYTIVYRWRALIPLYIFVILDGAFRGFEPWWIPFLYVWLPLWAIFMVVGKIKMRKETQIPLYMFLCALHGMAFGTLFAPFHALWLNLSWDQMLAWISAGLGFDIAHAIGNFAAGLLIIPLAQTLRQLEKQML